MPPEPLKPLRLGTQHGPARPMEAALQRNGGRDGCGCQKHCAKSQRADRSRRTLAPRSEFECDQHRRNCKENRQRRRPPPGQQGRPPVDRDCQQERGENELRQCDNERRGCSRRPPHQTVSTILPMWPLLSSRVCAAAASASAKVLSITGLTRPVAIIGNTCVFEGAGDGALVGDRAGSQRRAGMGQSLEHDADEVDRRLRSALEADLHDASFDRGGLVVALRCSRRRPCRG